MNVSAVVMDEINRLFPESDRAAVAELLSECESERLQIDVLRLSKRDVKNVRRWITEARRDYRDVITAAEYQRFRVYVLCFLHKGPNWEGHAGKLQKAHTEKVREWKNAGSALIGGQLLDQAEGWLYILLVDSLDEAKALIDSDPAVQGGHFTYELRPWRAVEGLRIVPLKDLPY
jgi:uncharacterized protein YciI